MCLILQQNERVIHMKKIRRFLTYVGFNGLPNTIKKKTIEINENFDFSSLKLPEDFIGFFITEETPGKPVNVSPSFFIVNKENITTIKEAKKSRIFSIHYGKLLLFPDNTKIIFNSKGDFIVLEEKDKTFSSLKEAIRNL